MELRANEDNKAKKSRALKIICAVALFALLIVVICMLACNLTHLDMGWYR